MMPSMGLCLHSHRHTEKDDGNNDEVESERNGEESVQESMKSTALIIGSFHEVFLIGLCDVLLIDLHELCKEGIMKDVF